MALSDPYMSLPDDPYMSLPDAASHGQAGSWQSVAHPDGTFTLSHPQYGTFSGDKNTVAQAAEIAAGLTHLGYQHYQIVRQPNGLAQVTVKGHAPVMASSFDEVQAALGKKAVRPDPNRRYSDAEIMAHARSDQAPEDAAMSVMVQKNPALRASALRADTAQQQDIADSLHGFNEHARQVAFALAHAGVPVPAALQRPVVNMAVDTLNPGAAMEMIGGAAEQPVQALNSLKEGFTNLWDPHATTEQRVASALQWASVVAPEAMHGFPAVRGFVRAGEFATNAARGGLAGAKLADATGMAVRSGIDPAMNAKALSVLHEAPQSPEVLAARQALGDMTAAPLNPAFDVAATTTEGDFVNAHWKERTQGLINALSDQIEQAGSSKKQKVKAAQMRTLRGDLRNSLATETPHPAIASELSDIFQKQHEPYAGLPDAKPPAVESPVAEPQVMDTAEAVAPEVAPPPAEAQAVETPSPEPAKETVMPQSTTPGETAARNAVSASEREAMGLDALPETSRKAMEATLQAAKDEGIDTQASRIAQSVVDKPRSLTDTETAGLALRKAQLMNEYDAAVEKVNGLTGPEKATAQTDLNGIKAEFDTITQALKHAGTEWGRTGIARRLTIGRDYSHLGFGARAAAEKPTALTAAESDKATQHASAIADLNRRLVEAESRAAKAEAKAEEAKIVRSVQKQRVGQAARGELNYRVKTADLPNLWKEVIGSSASLGVSFDQIQAIGKIALHYAERGQHTAEEIFALVKQSAPHLSDIDIWKGIRNGYGELGKSVNAGRGYGEDVMTRGAHGIESPEVGQLRKKLEQAKGKADSFIASLTPETGAEKAVRYQRASVLSGVSTIGKLMSATVQGKLADVLGDAAITPVMAADRAIGKLRGKPGVLSSRVVSETGLSFKGEAAGLKRPGGMFNEGALADTVDALKHGKNELERTYGKDAPKAEHWTDYITNLHKALKTPLQRSEYAKVYTKGIENAKRLGMNVDHPDVQATISLHAYERSVEAIMMNETKLTKGVGRLKNVSPPVSQLLVPISRAPANYVSRTLESVFGSLTGPSKLVRLAYREAKGITVTPREWDAAIKTTKRGLVGGGLVLAGANPPSWLKVSGYYSGPSKEPSGEISFKVGSDWVPLPHWLSHGPLFEPMLVGATFAKGSQRARSDESTFGASAYNAGRGIAEQIPGIPAVSSVASALKSKEGFSKEAAKVARTISEPQIVQQGVAAFDDKKRKPKTWLDELKMGVPGLRDQVPVSRR